MHSLLIPAQFDPQGDATPYLNPHDGSQPIALPEAGVLVSLRGTTYVVALPAREHGKPSLWRRLAGWRQSSEALGEPR